MKSNNHNKFVRLLVPTLLLGILILYFNWQQRIEINLNQAMAVEDQHIMTEYKPAILKGYVSRELLLSQLKVRSVFKGTLLLGDELIDIVETGLIKHNGKDTFVGYAESKKNDTKSTYYILITNDFKYFCLYNREKQTYTLAPVSSIEEYYKVDKIVN